MHTQLLNRLARIYPKQPVYFVTLCTHARKMILNRPTAHAAFVKFCEAAAQRGIFVGPYVLMPDHLHLFAATTPECPDLSLWIKSLKNALSKAWRSDGVPTPDWQKGFFDHLLRSTESYAEKWAYVVANPVRAGLAGTPDEWPFQGTICELTGSDLRRS